MSSSHAHWNRQESYKETYDTFYKLKQDVLLLKKKSNIHWPVQTYSSKVNKIKGRHGYTNTPKHYASKLNITKVPVYKAQPWDPQLTGKRPPTRYHTTNTANYHDPIFDDVSDYVDHQLSKHKEKDTVQQENKVDLVKDLSIQLVDKVLHQMMNTQQQQAHDWEFVLSNLIQTASLPPAVIDRIQREMEMKTAKETPVITAFNVTQSPLSDLTMSNTESEMNRVMKSLSEEQTRQQFQAEPGDEPFIKDMQWLMSLSQQDPHTQQKEAHKIQTDYTNKKLDLKRAFF